MMLIAEEESVSPKNRVFRFVAVSKDGVHRDVTKVIKGMHGYRFKIDWDDEGHVTEAVREVVVDDDIEEIVVTPDAEETADLLVRGVPAEAARRFKTSAGAREMTYATYLERLVGLHEAVRGRADAGDDVLTALLSELDLGTVTA